MQPMDSNIFVIFAILEKAQNLMLVKSKNSYKSLKIMTLNTLEIWLLFFP